MSSKARFEQLYEVLKSEEVKMHDQVVHLHGQMAYNRKMQEALNQQLQQLRELVDKEDVKVAASKSKVTKKAKK